MAPRPGLGPGTNRLTAGDSAIELPRRVYRQIFNYWMIYCNESNLIFKNKFDNSDSATIGNDFYLF